MNGVRSADGERDRQWRRRHLEPTQATSSSSAVIRGKRYARPDLGHWTAHVERVSFSLSVPRMRR